MRGSFLYIRIRRTKTVRALKGLGEEITDHHMVVEGMVAAGRTCGDTAACRSAAVPREIPAACSRYSPEDRLVQEDSL